MATEQKTQLAVPAAAMLLLWPALWNGYPIVFADSGTYLTQAVEHYAGWDRPVFYSLFMLPLHATVTVWPVIVAQALLAAAVLWLVTRTLLPGVPVSVFIVGTALLSGCTWLPWLVCELMPDLFTPLLVLVSGLLAWTPQSLSRRQQCALVPLAAFLIATQQSSLPLACVLLTVLGVIAVARLTRPATPPSLLPSRPPALPLLRRRRWALIVLPPVLAVLALCTVNAAAFKRFTITPFGNVFLLARVLYDGPGMATLRRECPSVRWLLCPYLGDFPADSDAFLWTPDSPLYRAGGAKIVSREADAIIASALHADLLGEARAALANTARQLTHFASGDGLEPWPAQVTPVIERHFPAPERAAYAAARQQTTGLAVPSWLAQIHNNVAVTGTLACVMLLPGAFRRRSICTGFLLAILIALPLGAAITGSLSAPHDRYQARLMWLPPLIAVLSYAALHRRPHEA